VTALSESARPWRIVDGSPRIIDDVHRRRVASDRDGSPHRRGIADDERHAFTAKLRMEQQRLRGDPGPMPATSPSVMASRGFVIS
jgi:hypothetical protein